MALTGTEETFVDSNYSLLETLVNTLFVDLSQEEIHDLICLGLTLGMAGNRINSETMGTGFFKAASFSTSEIAQEVYDFVSDTSTNSVFPIIETQYMPKMTKWLLRRVLSRINLWDWAGNNWVTTLSEADIVEEIGLLFSNFGFSCQNGWLRLYEHEQAEYLDNTFSLVAEDPILPATGRWGIVTNQTLGYEFIHNYENSVSGAVAGGTNTVVSVTTQALLGFYSLKATYTDTALLFSHLCPDLETTKEYVASCYIYIPTAWTGGTITITDNGTFSDKSGVSSNGANLALRDQWQEVSLTFTTGIDVAGNYLYLSAATPVATEFIYVDNFRITNNETLWQLTEEENNTEFDSIVYFGNVYRDALSLKDIYVSASNNPEYLTEVGIGIRNLQGYSIDQFLPINQTIFTRPYNSTETRYYGNYSFKEYLCKKAIEIKDYLGW